MACVDLTTSSLRTPLITSNVLSIGPLEEGVADDDCGLKAGVAPSKHGKQIKLGTLHANTAMQ